MSLPYWLKRFTEKTPVLDQGFVRLVDLMGDDGSVVEAARVTTGKGRSVHEASAGLDALGRRCCKVCSKPMERLPTQGPELSNSIREMRHAANVLYERNGGDVCLEGDRRLLRFMLRHQHWSPFHFAEMTIHLRLPMDAWRQLVRHWSLTPQEYSTRYSPAVDAMAKTAPDAWRAQGGSNRQGSSGFVTTFPEGFVMQDGYTPGDYLSGREAELHDLARDVYEERLAFGVAKEQARKDLPLSNYTEVYLKGNLRNWLNMLAQRLDGHAQYEIRQYAQAIAAIVKEWCPLTWAAFEDWRLNAQVLSAQQVELVRFLLADAFETAKELAASAGHVLDFDAWAKTLFNEYKVPASEAAEFLAKFKRPA